MTETLEAGLIGQAVIEELQRVFELHKAAFLSNHSPTLAQRTELMGRVPGLLRKYHQKILQALDADFSGHSNDQGDLKAYILYQPWGVLGNLVSWNYWIVLPHGAGTRMLIDKVAYAPMARQTVFAPKQPPKNLMTKFR